MIWGACSNKTAIRVTVHLRFFMYQNVTAEEIRCVFDDN